MSKEEATLRSPFNGMVKGTDGVCRATKRYKLPFTFGCRAEDADGNVTHTDSTYICLDCEYKESEKKDDV